MSRTQRTRRSRVHRSRPRNKALLGVLVVLVLVGVAGLSAVGYVVSIAASAPSLSSLKARDPGSNSEVLAADGSRLGFIQASELRLPAKGNEFPKILKDATVAIEDRRFYSHKGVDYEGIVRAAVKNLASKKTVQGGSTITMQLARNLYISNERTYERKIREAKVAEEIENEHSKQWILAKYLNTVPYGTVGGQSAIGAKAAARIYFNKRLGELNLREAALLAGLPQAPSLYSPLRSPGAAKSRRNDVLREMVKSKMITPETAEKTMRRGLGLDPSTYFTRRRESYFFDFVKDELIKEYGAKTVRLGGLAGAHDGRPQEAAGGARGDRREARRRRPLVGDRHDQPAQRLHHGDGVVGRLRQVEVQPRRPGAPAARLDVQGDGADGGAARRRRPRLDALHVALAVHHRGPGVRAHRRLDLRRLEPRQHQPARGHARVGQLRLHPARARPRPRQGQAGGVGPGRSAPSSTATRRRRSAASRTACRRWRWPTPTRRSPPAAIATGRPRSRA